MPGRSGVSAIGVGGVRGAWAVCWPWKRRSKKRWREASIADLPFVHVAIPQTGALIEFFAEDWTVAPTAEGALREPGHQFEWVWLLHEYSRVARDPGIVPYTERLFRFGGSFGVEHGGMVVSDDAGDRRRAARHRRAAPGIPVSGEARNTPLGMQAERSTANNTFNGSLPTPSSFAAMWPLPRRRSAPFSPSAISDVPSPSTRRTSRRRPSSPA